MIAAKEKMFYTTFVSLFICLSDYFLSLLANT